MLFIKIYEIAQPFSDPYSGFSKNVAQWQILLIFFVVLLIKEDVLGTDNSALLSIILILILFVNLVLDLICITLLFTNPRYLLILGILGIHIDKTDNADSNETDDQAASRNRCISSASEGGKGNTRSTELKTKSSSITSTMLETDSPLFAASSALSAN